MAHPARLFDTPSAAPIARQGPAGSVRPRLAGSRSSRDVVGVTDGDREAAERWLEGVRAGDVAAFDALCLAYAERLWRFAYSILGSRDGAQDVVQDVLLSIWERRASLDLSGSVTAYLLGACRRRALYYVRNHQTTERIGQQWPSDEIPGTAQLPEGPQRALERDETRRLLARALSELPETRRHIVALRWDQQLGYDDIARVMQITPDAARAQVSRAYRTLRALLQDMGVDAP